MPLALRLALAAIAVYFLYFHGLGDVGLIGPDEPRYASIGREMFFSGDWFTPRLWGEPWFEKPPLEYWGIGAAYAVGFDDNLAPRLFNALLGSAFLVLYWKVLKRQFSAQVAWIATAILATSAAWIAESRIAVMDLPLTVTFSAAMLLALSGRLILAAVCLALATLAKGLVPLVLVLPALWFLRHRWRQLALPAIVFLAVAQPWYIFMAVRHGRAFLDEFFVKHHFSRFTEAGLQHVQPFWFFLPVILLALFPWTPLAALLRWPSDEKRRFLFVWFVWVLLFFSISRNKLPGYVLPAVPPLAALAGLVLLGSKKSWAWCGACGAMLGLTAVVSDLLPAALSVGLTRANVDLRITPFLLIAIGGFAAGAWQHWRAVAALTALIVPLLAFRTFPVLEDSVSTRGFWKSIEERRNDVCIETMDRDWRYGLNFYSIDPLPDCSVEPKRVRITQQGSERPEILVEPRTAFPGPTASPDPGAF